MASRQLLVRPRTVSWQSASKRTYLLERGNSLGAQTPFEHSTQADKFIYEAELRTGMGAHFRYAEHLSAALKGFFVQVPEARDWVVEGTAEPE